MTLDKRKLAQMLEHCDEIHADDGVNPRALFKSHKQRNQGNRKARQLCSQVAETLGLALAGDFDDELLHNLQVVSVKPAPDASQLAVGVRADLPQDQIDTQRVLDRLANIAGRLRCEVAAAITRKRAPKLIFHLVANDEEVRP